MDYKKSASKESLIKVESVLKLKNIEVTILNNRREAFEKVKSLIPKGSTINNGSSTTLQEIGWIDYLKMGTHGWNNLHEAVMNEKDPARQAELRKPAHFADYYLGSVHALSETGEMVIASATGSQLPSLANTAKNIILVVGTQKIVPTLEEALKRLCDYVVPLEDKRMKSAGFAGTVLSKILIFEQEPIYLGRKVHVILVNEKLGF